MPQSFTYKDLNVTFKKHPVTDDLIVSKDSAAIKQAISNLLLTGTGERFFQPELGSKIPRLLFEPFDFASSALIKDEINRVLVNYEPRIKIDRIDVFPNYDANGYDVDMTIIILGREDEIIGIDVFLERTR
jgi:phage baseplate assembly protein W